MSFGFSIGDFVAVGKLAFEVYKQCQGCSGQYRELSNDAGQLALLLTSFEDLIKQGRIRVSTQRQLLGHGQSCRQVLLDIEATLKKYESLSLKSKKLHDIFGWDHEGARELRDRLTATVVMLSAFYQTVTTTSIYRIEDAMARILRQIKTGQKSADSVSILSTISHSSTVTPQAWRLIISDLEDLGITAEEANKHRNFIVQHFAAAIQAATVERAKPDIPSSPNDRDAAAATDGQPDPGESCPRLNLLDAPGPGSRDFMQVSFTLRQNLPVFGLSLEELHRRDKTPCPAIVLRLISAVEQSGMRSGFYSQSLCEKNYVLARFKAMEGMRRGLPDQQFLDLGPDNTAWLAGYIPHVAAALIKFLANLPVPLLTEQLQQERKKEHHLSSVGITKKVLTVLPSSHYFTLRLIALHLKYIASDPRHSDIALHGIFRPWGIDAFYGSCCILCLDSKRHLLLSIIRDAAEVFDTSQP